MIKKLLTGCILTVMSVQTFANGGFSVRYYGAQSQKPAPASSDTSKGIMSDLAGIIAEQDDDRAAKAQRQPQQKQPQRQEQQQQQVQQQQPRLNSEASLWMTSNSELNAQYHRDIENILAASNQRSQQNRQTVQSYNTPTVKAQPVSFSVPSAIVSSGGSSSKYDALISHMANKHNVSFGLIKAVMHTESAFNPNARSHAGAQGLMQLMPATARRFNVNNSYDPIQNVEGGVKYLSWLTKRFNGDLRLTLAGYNAGEGNVDKYGGIPPFKETQQYVQKVIGRYNGLYREF